MMKLLCHFRSFTNEILSHDSCGELKSFVLDWGGVLQEIEIDTEHFDLHRSIPVDKDVSFIGCSGDPPINEVFA